MEADDSLLQPLNILKQTKVTSVKIIKRDPEGNSYVTIVQCSVIRDTTSPPCHFIQRNKNLLKSVTKALFPVLDLKKHVSSVHKLAL